MKLNLTLALVAFAPTMVLAQLSGPLPVISVNTPVSKAPVINNNPVENVGGVYKPAEPSAIKSAVTTSDMTTEIKYKDASSSWSPKK
jgi:hypothetical protein